MPTGIEISPRLPSPTGPKSKDLHPSESIPQFPVSFGILIIPQTTVRRIIYQRIRIRFTTLFMEAKRGGRCLLPLCTFSHTHTTKGTVHVLLLTKHDLYLNFIYRMTSCLDAVRYSNYSVIHSDTPEANSNTHSKAKCKWISKCE